MAVEVRTHIDDTVRIGILHEGCTLENELEVLHIAGNNMGIFSNVKRWGGSASRNLLAVHNPLYMVTATLSGNERHRLIAGNGRARFHLLRGVLLGDLQICPSSRFVDSLKGDDKVARLIKLSRNLPGLLLTERSSHERQAAKPQSE